MAAVARRVHPSAFHRRFTEEGIRPDGRLAADFRPTTVHLSSIASAAGSALARIGSTTVVCGIKAEVCEPDPRFPDRGFILPNIELGPLCSSRFKPGAPSEASQVLGESLLRHILCVVNPRDLCIVEDKAVWVLYIDCVCLNHDGNIEDAALLAVSAALRSTELPRTVYVEEEGAVKASVTDFSPLKLSGDIYAASFSILKSGTETMVISDPDSLEEGIQSATITVAIDSISGRVISIDKPGGLALSVDEMANCVDAAQKRAAELKQLVDSEGIQVK